MLRNSLFNRVEFSRPNDILQSLIGHRTRKKIHISNQPNIIRKDDVTRCDFCSISFGSGQAVDYSCIEGIEIFNSEDVSHFCIDDRVSVVEIVCLFSEIYPLSISFYISLLNFCLDFYLIKLENQLCCNFCIKQSIIQSTLFEHFHF